jgi:hypothetical protein
LGVFVRVSGAEFKYQTQHQRRYLYLPPAKDLAGLYRNARIRFRRLWHIGRGACIATTSVGRIAGPALGLYAGLLTIAQATYLTARHFWRRLQGRLGPTP